MPLGEVEVDITRTVVYRFLNLGEPTPRKGLLLRAKSRELLERLVRWSVLRIHDNKNYFPLAFAFHCCGDTALSLLAKQSVTAVAHVLKNLCENDPFEDTQYTLAAVESHAKNMYGTLDPKWIQLGMYLGQDFSFFVQWTPNPQQTGMVSCRINEHVIEIDPDTVWDDFIKRQAEWIETQAAGGVHPTALEISDTQGSQKDTTEEYGGWQIVKQLSNRTGQAEVFLVRSPHRVAGLAEAAKAIQGYMSGISLHQAPAFAAAIWQSARADSVSELGALKVFKMRGDGAEAEQEVLDRLKGEIHVLEQNKPGLLKLLASSEEEKWIITEYQPNGTLEDFLFGFKGKASLALRAFRPLVQTVAALHTEGTVHRDIKPANVFVGDQNELIWGDFGIVYLPGQPERVTRTNERVGPFDYMPPWADLGERLEKVEFNFDVYMLGKLLWCMVAGRLRLPRERYRESGFDLTQTFPDDPHMHIINTILDKCVVGEAKDCLAAATDLLSVVDTFLRVIDRDGRLLGEKIPRPCRICGMGHYQLKLIHKDIPDVSFRLWRSRGAADTAMLPVRVFICDNCQHIDFFASN